MEIERSEWESFIFININESMFENIRNCKEDIIFIFDDGIRITQREIQKKITNRKEHIVGFHDNKFFPITRTKSFEIKSKIGNGSIIKVVHRKLILNRDNIRLSYNKVEIENGVKYVLQCEIEYEASCDYEEILKHEKKLMTLINDYYHLLQLDEMCLQKIFSCNIRKLQVWNCFNPNQSYYWAYKWNGIKAKFIYSNKNIYIWPDGDNIKTATINQDDLLKLKIIENLCLQVEIMDSFIIVVEIISLIYDNELYIVEPQTNISILNRLHNYYEHLNLTIDKKLWKIQCYFKMPKPENYNEEMYDGFIIFQNNISIKWKLPTIDVKYMGEDNYEVAGKLIKLNSNNSISCETGKIYEISADYMILRQRIDRLASSTEAELTIFLRSIKKL